ncbi:hypothetical protein SAMN06295885_0314 [Rathayibacter oskolensis]|uniref:Lipoprotein n=1 Tax=Rathayibacter oskolensis TaxID=1891671 RepID=A0A1X7MZI0_9MICO|nr:hypothetical protein [Rathayibacter oskolensis]SMH29448.1 hypothetical protein SAMN06295885_0314 [Rathayibacter oskolensis]
MSLAIAAALCLLVALAGCTVPPAGAAESVDALAERVRASAGVESVETSLRQSDPKDRPDDWVATVDVTASDADLAAVASVVRDAIGSGVDGARLSLTLRVPAGDGGVAVDVDPRRGNDVARAARLRLLPFAAAVLLSGYREGVELTAEASFSEAVPVVREVARSIDLFRGTTTVAVDEAFPGAALLALVDPLDADPRTSSLSLSASSASASQSSVSSVSITREDTAAVAGTLAATPDEEADAGTAARTSFSVQSPDYSTVVAGWLGLPLGSPEPPLPDPAAPATAEPDPAALAAAESRVKDFLDRSVAETGVPAEVATRVEECSDGRGSRAAGGVVIPVFTVYDSAQESFDAVVDGWTADGFDRIDRASGRDFWGAVTPWGGGVISASIRGTIDGLSLTAESECVVG